MGNIWTANRLAEKDVGITVNHNLSMSLSVMLLHKEPSLYYKYKQREWCASKPSALLSPAKTSGAVFGIVVQKRSSKLIRVQKKKQIFVNGLKKGSVGN